MSLVTSLVTKKIFWILFPKITVGDIPEMLSIKVNRTKVLAEFLFEWNGPEMHERFGPVRHLHLCIPKWTLF